MPQLAYQCTSNCVDVFYISRLIKHKISVDILQLCSCAALRWKRLLMWIYGPFNMAGMCHCTLTYQWFPSNITLLIPLLISSKILHCYELLSIIFVSIQLHSLSGFQLSLVAKNCVSAQNAVVWDKNIFAETVTVVFMGTQSNKNIDITRVKTTLGLILGYYYICYATFLVLNSEKKSLCGPCDCLNQTVTSTIGKLCEVN